MSDAPSYATPVAIGQVMEGRTVSEVAGRRTWTALPLATSC